MIFIMHTQCACFNFDFSLILFGFKDRDIYLRREKFSSIGEINFYDQRMERTFVVALRVFETLLHISFADIASL